MRLVPDPQRRSRDAPAEHDRGGFGGGGVRRAGRDGARRRDSRRRVDSSRDARDGRDSVGRRGSAALAEVLASDACRTTLERLYLPGAALGPLGVETVCASAPASLVALDVGSNNAGDRGADARARARVGANDSNDSASPRTTSDRRAPGRSRRRCAITARFASCTRRGIGSEIGARRRSARRFARRRRPPRRSRSTRTITSRRRRRNRSRARSPRRRLSRT